MAEANWYWAQGENQNGPVVPSALVRLVSEGTLGGDDLIWKDGMAEWVPIRKVSSLAKYLKQAPGAALAPQPVPPAQATATVQPAGVIAYQEGPVDRRAVHEFVGDSASQAICPHCSVPNTPGSQYCESCGLALPQPNFGPRIIDESNFATTAAGKQLQSDELHKQTSKASTALMWVAIIQTVVGSVLLAVAGLNNRMSAILTNPLALGVVAFAVIFWALYVWSRSQPLPAAIVGLVLYATLVVLNVVNAVSQMGSGNARQYNGIGNTGVGWIDIVIMVVLGQAISAGLKYRKMNADPSAQPADAVA